MPSPTKGYCELRQLEVDAEQMCDYYESAEPDKRMPPRCPFCSHFNKKPKRRKTKQDSEQNNSQ
jgi:hypothetical protein